MLRIQTYKSQCDWRWNQILDPAKLKRPYDFLAKSKRADCTKGANKPTHTPDVEAPPSHPPPFSYHSLATTPSIPQLKSTRTAQQPHRSRN